MNRAAHILERFAQLLFLLALTVGIWAYPLRVQNSILNGIGARIARSPIGRALEALGLDLAEFYSTHVIDYVRLLQYTLEFKAAIIATALLLLVAVWLLTRLTSASPERRPGAAHSARLHLPLFLLLCWNIASIHWSPAAYSSFTAIALSLLYFFAFFALYDLPKPYALTRKWLDWFLIMMLPVCLISFMQHAAPEELHKFFPDIGIRNRIASVIGHNIALAAFCLTAFYVTLTRMVEPGGRVLMKLLMTLYSIFLLFLLIVAQTRAIWLIGTLGCAALVYQAKRISGFRLGRRFWSVLAFLLVFFALFQIVDNPLNVVKRRGMTSLYHRLRDFSPTVLREGTHFRILVCALPLIAQRPLLGHGINSFGYVYPRAQGEYLFNRPDTMLRPTEFQSAHAHNDYLQIAIETGLIGLGLTLWMIAAYVIHGWRGYRRIADVRVKLQYLAVGAGLVSILLHGLIFFPLYVSHHSLLLIWLAATWAGLEKDQLLQPEEETRADVGLRSANARALESTVNQIGLEMGYSISEIARLRAGLESQPAKKHFAVLIGALVAIPVVVLLAPFYFKIQQRSIFLSRSKAYFSTFRELADWEQVTPRQKNQLLNSAEFWLRRAAALDRLYTPTYLDMATLYQLKADTARRQRELCLDDELTTEAARLYRLSAENFRKAEESLDWSLQETRSHFTFHMRGLIYEGWWLLTGRPELKERARQAYIEAVRYSKAYGPSLINLSNLYYSDQPRNWNMINQFRNILYQYAYNYWEAQYVRQIYRFFVLEQYDAALASAEELLRAVPGDHTLLMIKLGCLQNKGLLQEARLVLRGAAASGVMSEYTRDFGELWQALYEKNWPRIVETAELMLAREDFFRSTNPLLREQFKQERWMVEIAHALALEALGDPRAGQALEALQRRIDKLNQVRSGGWHYQLEIAKLYLLFFNQPQRGIALFREQAEQGYCFPGHLVHVMRYYAQRGEREQALRFFGYLEKWHPRDPQLRLIRREFQIGAADADGAADATADSTD